MYAYDNGMKNKNVGFAKTECRGEELKLWINLKGAYSQEENYRVHFFVRRDDAIVGIYMGDIAIKSGMGQFFVAKPLSDIEVPFEDFCGLYIDSEPGARMFASQWDDLPFETRKIVEFKDFAAVGAQEELIASSSTPQEPIAPETSQIAAPETKTAESKKIAANIETGTSHAAATAEAPVWERPIKMMYVADNSGENIVKNIPDDGKETAKDIQGLHVSEDEPQVRAHSKIDMLFDGKEPVLAFSEDEIYDCVDIGLDELPKIGDADRGLINNSFVNHGYFNFHHLLLGKKDGNILVVGVPGVYNRREKITANMFGFEKFKFSMRSDICMNHFGYWYKEYQYQ